MKKYTRFACVVLIMIMTLVMAIALAGCGKDTEEAASAGGGNETAEGTDENTDGTSDGGEETSEAADENGPAGGAEVVSVIEGIDEDLGPRLPLMIESITLYDDGTVAIVPTDELRKNELGDSSASAAYPFAESGEVADVQVVDYGNGGYRTIVALMKNGTISVVNGRALVEDHIFAVLDNVASRDNFVSIENVTDEDASAIVATTEDGEEITLDFVLSFEEPEQG